MSDFSVFEWKLITPSELLWGGHAFYLANNAFPIFTSGNKGTSPTIPITQYDHGHYIEYVRPH